MVVGMKMLIWWWGDARARKKKKVPETSRDYGGRRLTIGQNQTTKFFWHPTHLSFHFPGQDLLFTKLSTRYLPYKIFLQNSHCTRPLSYKIPAV